MHQKIAERVVDLDPQETTEWLEALDQVLDEAGPDRASYLLERLNRRATAAGAELPLHTQHAVHQHHPGRGRSAVSRRPRDRAADQEPDPLERDGDGGRTRTSTTTASAATSPPMRRWPRCWKSASTISSTARYGDQPGDLVYFQGHASPGVYARAFLEGRLSEEHLENFRHELREHPGLSSYPHPWLMPDFWQFPTVSMGLGPINAIYQARFMRYLENRGMIPETPRKVWAFLGDGEMDEPESMGAITLASREKLDNLIFVDQLQSAAAGRSGARQRQDHPGAGSRVPRRRLERDQGACGASDWDPLLAARHDRPAAEAHGTSAWTANIRAFKAKGGAYVRKEFFGRYPETAGAGGST